MRIRDESRIRELFTSSHSVAVRDELAALIASTGALLQGHFRLQSGLHSPYFLRFGQLAYEPRHAARIAELALRTLDVPATNEDVVVLSAETAASFLGIALAEAIGADLAVAAVDQERRPKEELRRGRLEGRRQVLIATDVVTSGRSAEVLGKLAFSNTCERASLVAFACLDGRGIAPVLTRLGAGGGALLQASWTNHAATDCALCRERKLELVPALEFN